jgi:lipopolysaccharide biosynthesis glycosyltransferase
MNKPLNIFFSIDKNYIQHFTVALTSLLENNRDLPLSIFVIHNIDDLSLLDKTITHVKDKYGLILKLIDISNIDFSRFTTNVNYTSATYFRLFLAQIIPEDVDSGLVLDSDLVVTGSIKELANIDLSKKYIYAASEAFPAHNIERFKKIGFNANGYFNSGVSLINLKAWRDLNLTAKFLSIADNYMDKLEWYDQDILNIHFLNNWGQFDSKYNAVHITKELSVMPVIVHYASYSKPWHYVDTHPYNFLYGHYLKLTPFKNNKPVGFTLKNFVLKHGRLFKRRLRKAGVIKY